MSEVDSNRDDVTDGSLGRVLVRPLVASSTTVFALIALLVAVDLAFIVFDVVAGASDTFPDRMRLARERGIPEFFQYGKWLLAAALMWQARRVAALYVVWAVTFLVLLADDSLSLHERFGLATAPYAPTTPFGLDIEPYVLPQLLLQSGMGLLLLVALVIVARRTPSVTALRFSAIGLFLLAVLAGFAIGADFVLDLITDRGSNREAQIFEEGGELLVGSMLLAHVLLEVSRLANRAARGGSSRA